MLDTSPSTKSLCLLLREAASAALQKSSSNIVESESPDSMRVTLLSNNAGNTEDFVIVARVRKLSRSVKLIATAFRPIDADKLEAAMRCIATANHTLDLGYFAIDQHSKEFRLYNNISYDNVDDITQLRNVFQLAFIHVAKVFREELISMRCFTTDMQPLMMVAHTHNDNVAVVEPSSVSFEDCEDSESSESDASSESEDGEDMSCSDDSVDSYDVDEINADNDGVAGVDRREFQSLFTQVRKSVGNDAFHCISVNEHEQVIVVKARRSCNSLCRSLLLSISIDEDTRSVTLSSVMANNVSASCFALMQRTIERLNTTLQQHDCLILNYKLNRVIFSSILHSLPRQINLSALILNALATCTILSAQIEKVSHHVDTRTHLTAAQSIQQPLTAINAVNLVALDAMTDDSFDSSMEHIINELRAP